MKKILYLGPNGSYTQKATNKAIEILNYKNFTLEPCFTINEIISQVDDNDDCIGVIPIENSIEGVVRETVDKLVRTKTYLRIFQEIIIPVSHCLSNISGDINDVRTIISHPQALAQCRDYIKALGNKLNRNISIKTASSTSQAAKLLSTFDNSYAAISSEDSANLYKIKILDTSINDEKDNKTRFICIGKSYPNKTGNDRTSIAFTTLNKPGALVDVLSVLKEYNLNMSHIDSRPSKKILGEYMFYLDIDGHIEDENVHAAFEKIKPFITYYRLLGAYPKFNEDYNA